jgi:hypothetical protein
MTVFCFFRRWFGFWDTSPVFVCLLFFECLGFRLRPASHQVMPLVEGIIRRGLTLGSHLAWNPGSSKCPQPRALPTSFLTFKFSYFFFPIKLKLELQIGWRLLINTHVDQSNYRANQPHVLGFAVPFTSLNKPWKNAEPNCHVWLFFTQFWFSGSHNDSRVPVEIYQGCT